MVSVMTYDPYRNRTESNPPLRVPQEAPRSSERGVWAWMLVSAAVIIVVALAVWGMDVRGQTLLTQLTPVEGSSR